MSALLERTRLRVGAARPRTIPPCRGPARAGAPARFQRPRGRVARAAPEDDREEPSRDELIAKLNKSLEGLDEPMDGEVRHTNHTAAPRSSAPESTSLTRSLASPLPPPHTPLPHLTLKGAEESGHGALGPGVRHEDLPQEGRSRSDAAVLAG